jgi:hypothetical protein
MVVTGSRPNQTCKDNVYLWYSCQILTDTYQRTDPKSLTGGYSRLWHRAPYTMFSSNSASAFNDLSYWILYGSGSDVRGYYFYFKLLICR